MLDKRFVTLLVHAILNNKYISGALLAKIYINICFQVASISNKNPKSWNKLFMKYFFCLIIISSIMPLKFLHIKRRAMIIENMKLPEYSLSESLKFIEPIVFSNLSSINKDHFAKLRSFNPSGGAFNLRLSSSRLWGLVTDGNPFKPTSLAREILLHNEKDIKLKKIYQTSKNFNVFNKLSRDLNINPSINDISRLLGDKYDNKILRKIKNIIIDIRLHSNNFSPTNENFIQTTDLKLQLNGINIDVEESRESILAAIKLLESRLDLFRI